MAPDAPAQLETLAINEMFVSLQGEGMLVGTPSSFVRVAGCNLRCVWCDSPQTSWDPVSRRIAMDDVLDFCAAGPRHVVITGGEPLLFPVVASLTTALHQRGHHITVETAGTRWLEGTTCDLVSLSPKLKHSTPSEPLAWRQRHDDRRFQPRVVRQLMDAFSWQLKFVVRPDPQQLAADEAEILAMLEELNVEAPDRVLLMPECIAPNALETAYRALTPVCQRHGFRLGQRLHIALFGHTPGT